MKISVKVRLTDDLSSWFGFAVVVVVGGIGGDG